MQDPKGECKESFLDSLQEKVDKIEFCFRKESNKIPD